MRAPSGLQQAGHQHYGYKKKATDGVRGRLAANKDRAAHPRLTERVAQPPGDEWQRAEQALPIPGALRGNADPALKRQLLQRVRLIRHGGLRSDQGDTSVRAMPTPRLSCWPNLRLLVMNTAGAAPAGRGARVSTRIARAARPPGGGAVPARERAISSTSLRHARDQQAASRGPARSS